MISRHGFLKGDTVEFQNYQRAWIRGTVVDAAPSDVKIEGPSVRLVENKRPSTVMIKYYDSFERGYRVRELPTKRVRAVKP